MSLPLDSDSLLWSYAVDEHIRTRFRALAVESEFEGHSGRAQNCFAAYGCEGTEMGMHGGAVESMEVVVVVREILAGILESAVEVR